MDLGGLVPLPPWQRVSETFALAGLVPLRNTRMSSLERAGILVLVLPREICCSFSPGVGFPSEIFTVTEN